MESIYVCGLHGVASKLSKPSKTANSIGLCVEGVLN